MGQTNLNINNILKKSIEEQSENTGNAISFNSFEYSHKISLNSDV